MAKASDILGVDHVGVFTPRIEEAERHYERLFGTSVLFRGTTHRGTWVAVDGDAAWDDITRRGLRIEASFLRAGPLTIIVADEPAGGKAGPLDHVGVACSAAEFKRIRERVRAMELRVLGEEADSFKVRDAFGVVWEISRGLDAARRPTKRIDLTTGRVD